MNAIKWFSDINEGDINSIGYNGYGLGILYKSKFPVANGFCITKHALMSSLVKANLKYFVDNVDNKENLGKEEMDKLVIDARNSILNSDFGYELKNEINEAYSNMSVSTELHGLTGSSAISLIKTGRDLPYVVIRPSISKEVNSLHIVKGVDNILISIKKCIADCIGNNIVEDLLKEEINEEDIYPGIIVQKLVSSNMAGEAYNNGNIVVNAYLGLLNSDKIKMDRYTIDNELNIKDVELNNQAYLFALDEGLGRIVKRETFGKKGKQILNEDEIKKLGKIINDITDMIGHDKKIEWAVEEGRLFITNVKNIEQGDIDDKIDEHPDTITDVSLSIRDEYEDINYKDANGIGYIESMLLMNKDEYFDYIRDDMPDVVVSNIAEKLVKIASNLQKDVWYKLIDKAEKFYDWRYKFENSSKDEELIGLELAAIKKARGLGHKNIGLLLAMVNDANRVKKIKEIIKNSGLEPGKDVKIGAIIDNPAGCQMIEEICREGINFISIDINRLARYSLAAKKDNVDEMHPSVIKQISRLVDEAGKNNVKIGVSNFNANPEMIERLVKLGVDNIAANNDDFEFVRSSVAKVERRLLLNVARDAFKKTIYKG